jgi:hypothetical protein
MSTSGTTPIVAISEYLRNGIGAWPPDMPRPCAAAASAPVGDAERGGSARFDIWLGLVGRSRCGATIALQRAVVSPAGHRRIAGGTPVARALAY